MGFKIKEVRDKVGISQTELAHRSGVSRALINALENGTRDVTTTKTLCKLAEALGVTVDEIFSASQTA